MNKERLIAVRDFIQEHKDRFDYSRYGGVKGETKDKAELVDLHNCSTVGCIAGWTQALHFGGRYDGDCESFARKHLGLDYNESEWLFFAETPRAERCRESLFNTRYGTVEEALNRLNHLIEHGTIDGYKYPEVDWSLVEEDKYNVD